MLEITGIVEVYIPFIEGLIVVSCLSTILLLLKVIDPVVDVDVVKRGILGAVVVVLCATTLLLLLMMVLSCGLKMWNLIRNLEHKF